MAVPNNRYTERREKTDLEMMKMSIGVALNSLKRLNSIEDPMLRYSLLVEGLRILMPAMMEAFKIKLVNDNMELHDKMTDNEIVESEKHLLYKIKINDQTIDQVDETIHLIDKYFDGFSSWVRQPIYSPDHPYGNNIMKDSKNNFETKQ